MTDEERQKLCEALRGKRAWPGALAKLMPDAADELERLALENKILWEALPEGITTIKQENGHVIGDRGKGEKE
jgi:hypothetical protein